MLIFLIFRAEAYTCWSARFSRSRVGGVARLLKEISVFFSDSGIFSVFEFFGHFDSFVAFHHERAAFYHGKRPFLVILTHLWHFIISKNVVLGHFNKFRFLIIFSVFESLAASEIEQVASKYEKKTLFLTILSKFGVLTFLGIFESLAASEIQQVASKHE